LRRKVNSLRQKLYGAKSPRADHPNHQWKSAKSHAARHHRGRLVEFRGLPPCAAPGPWHHRRGIGGGGVVRS
jgi:hypothetical protein